MALKIFDITPKISPALAVFPGDQPFERRVAMSMAAGAHLELSAMLTTLHLGAHADAPSHYGLGAGGIATRPVGRYMGRAQVVRCRSGRGRIGVRELPSEIRAPRVLFDTASFPDPDTWRDDFRSLSPELLTHLADKGVFLVGIDTPSVDPADSKGLESHSILLKRDMSVLEGLVLSEVPEGIYTLIALPLPIVDGDASPVRAVLLPEVTGFPEFGP